MNVGQPAVRGQMRRAPALPASSKPDLPLTGDGLQGQTQARERTSVLDLRLQQHLLLKVPLLLPRPAGLGVSHPEPRSALERGDPARDAGHASAWFSPIASPLPARPTGRGEVPTQASLILPNSS